MQYGTSSFQCGKIDIEHLTEGHFLLEMSSPSIQQVYDTML